LVLLDLSPGAQGGGLVKWDDVTSHRVQPKTMVAAEINLETPRVDLPEDQPVDGGGNQDPRDNNTQMTRAHLVGIYSGQIRARVERIWRRPRTPVSEAGGTTGRPNVTSESFQCQVTIVQDSMGWVQETQLLDCNGSIAWQQSLVRAINQASPLPAPPDPKVFTRTVTLNFVGFEFGPGMNADDYELKSNCANSLRECETRNQLSTR
jgi:hypothetical protein